MMKTKQWIGIGTSLLLLIGCSTDEKMDTPASLPEVTAYPISCSVHQASGMAESRALIDGATQAERDAALQAACTPGTGGEAVAIYGSYTVGSGAATTVFNNTTLVYDASVGTNDETNRISWNYANEQYWTKEATYDFRACYPQNALSGSSTALSGTYNTLTQQKDLMVAYTQVNTATYNLSQPVSLQMNHALAAVKLVVKSADNTEQELKSLSLSGIFTQGTFAHTSTTAPQIADWTALTGNGSYNYEGTMSFGNTEKTVTGYTAASPLGSYADDGFILMIPQEDCQPVLNLETDFKRYTDISLGEVDFEPGKKYTYTITINATGYTVTLQLDVKDWNLYDEDIQFTEELTIAADGQMTWNQSNPNVTANAADPSLLYINGCTDLASALVFNFQIDTPIGADWYASFEGDKDAFAFIDEEGNPLVNSNGISSANGKVGEPATLRIITVQQDVAEMKTVTLRIVVRTMDGRTIVAHEELMPINNKEYYTIRQNLTIVG